MKQRNLFTEKRKKKKGKPLQLQVKFLSTYGKHITERNHKSSQLLVTIITVFFFLGKKNYISRGFVLYPYKEYFIYV